MAGLNRRTIGMRGFLNFLFLPNSVAHPIWADLVSVLFLLVELRRNRLHPFCSYVKNGGKNRRDLTFLSERPSSVRLLCCRFDRVDDFRLKKIIESVAVLRFAVVLKDSDAASL